MENEVLTPAGETTEDKKFVEKVKKVLATFIWEAVAFDLNRRKKDSRFEYPKTVAECINDAAKYKPETYKALQEFSKANPWKGTQEEVQSKFRILNEELAKIYKIAPPQLVFVEKFPSGPCCFPESKPAVIMMQPEKDKRYSVVVFLHEFAHALGKDENGACRWSLNLFKRVFPSSFARLEPKGHLLFRKKAVNS